MLRSSLRHSTLLAHSSHLRPEAIMESADESSPRQQSSDEESGLEHLVSLRTNLMPRQCVAHECCTARYQYY